MKIVICLVAFVAFCTDAAACAVCDYKSGIKTTKIITDRATGEKLKITTCKIMGTAETHVFTCYAEGKLAGELKKMESFGADKKFSRSEEYLYSDDGSLAQFAACQDDSIRLVTTFHVKGKLKGRAKTFETYQDEKLVKRDTVVHNKKGDYVCTIDKTPKPPKSPKKPKPADTSLFVPSCLRVKFLS